MNTKIKLSAVIIIALLGLFAVTTPVSAMTCNSATITGNVITGTPPTHARFTYSTEYGTVANGGGRPTAVQIFNSEGTFPIQQFLSGLSEKTTYYYRLEVTNNYGTQNLNIENFTTPSCGQTALPPTVHLTADNYSLNYNGSTILRWTTTNNPTSCTGSGGTNSWSGNKNLSDTFNTGALTGTTTYNITCTNSVGSANDSVTVVVNQNQTCQDTSATNYGGTAPCTYPQVCQDYTAINYHGSMPCRYNYTCQDTDAINYGGTAPCRYDYTYNTCRDTSAINYGGALPCRYQNYYNNVSVSISADQTNIPYNGSTTIRWYPINATSCYASGGSNGWAGSRSSYSGSFYTGTLAYTTTYTISCSNYNNYNNGYYSNNNSDVESVTVFVGGNQIQNDNSLTATTTAATKVLNTSAQLNSLITNSGSTPANAWFEWGTTINLGNKTNSTAVGSLPSVVHADNLSGLNPGTTYYFRAVAENSLWRNIGNILTFTTGGQNTIIIRPPVTPKTPLTAMVLISSSVDRNQPIVPTIDNTRPHPGDEINYTVNYQNVGTGAITNLTLRITLPGEVDYMFSNPNNPNISGNNLIFNLGTLKANGQGTVTVKVRVRDNIAPGTNLNFPAVLSYVDPSGQPQSVSANVSAQVWNGDNTPTNGSSSLSANVFGAGFFPGNLFGWLFLIILILVLVLLVKYLYGAGQSLPFRKKTTTTTVQH